MSTGAFSCPWDSGRVGLIYISKETILKEWGGKYLTKKRIEQAEKCLESEVKVYDQFIRGQVYWYRVEKLDEDGEVDEEIDSCGGYFGDEYDDEGYMLSVIRDAIKYDITNSPQQQELSL